MLFISPEPKVRLTKAFVSPFRNTVATARTCYSSRGIVGDDEVGEKDRFAGLAKSIYEAGHHTTFQHAHFQFTIENVSRQAIWGFLHAHPFYNSEQVSQRYVAVKEENLLIPALQGEALALYRQATGIQFRAYEQLCELLMGPVEAHFHRRFPKSERMAKRHETQIRKRAQEVARYVLPVATHAFLYHTVSAITLLRYWRMCRQYDCPQEQYLLAKGMVEEVLRWDPDYEVVLQEPLAEGAVPETALWANLHRDGESLGAMREEFDRLLDGRVSRLVDWSARGESQVADGVREVLGLGRAVLDDESAIAAVLDPGSNRLLGESLNLTTLSKATRALHHPHYTFAKCLSHAADSQDQRHRMLPGSRPMMLAHLAGDPDYVTPPLVQEQADALRIYQDTMEATWEIIGKLKALGIPAEQFQYLLPNSVKIRFRESGDFLNLHHKCRMRLCYNAQEEIWAAARDEAMQISEVHPLLGRWLLPPCTLRLEATSKPICPEGVRYCGVRVWKLDVSEYERVI